MAPSTIRKAIGAVKDQTSISIAKVAGNLAPELEVLVVKATSHDEDPAGEKYVREIVGLTATSRGYVGALVAAVSKRLSKTRDWIVALKCLVLVHRVLAEGHASFQEEIVFASRRGVRVLNMADFRDEAHSGSWDHSSFVRLYAVYLDEKVESIVYEKKKKRAKESGNKDMFDFGPPRRSRSYGDLAEPERGRESSDSNPDPAAATTPMREMRPELVLDKLSQSLRILDRVLACRPAGAAKTSRLVIVALYQVVKESFATYWEVSEALRVLSDRFTDLGYEDGVKAFDVCVGAAKMVDELAGFYGWCKDVGIARSSEFPEVQRVSDQALARLDGLLKEMANRPKREEKARVKDNEVAQDMKEIKALPPPENQAPPPTPPLENHTSPPPLQPPVQRPKVIEEDLVDLRDNGVSADEQSNGLALALFSEPAAAGANASSWEAFPSGEVTSAWQNPAAESGRADWEVALVESASHLSRQKAEMGGGMDPLLLSGMYDHQQATMQNVGQAGAGSASSVSLPGGPAVLALPGPDGTARATGQWDPFAASAAVPPPAYVQMAEMQRKQQLLVQEQQAWQQYGGQGMQGLPGGSGYYGPNPHQTMPGGGGGYYY